MLILASQSPIRATILRNAGLRFVVRAAGVDERAAEAGLDAADPGTVARRLAEAKAVAVSRLEPGAVVIGADQVLALGDEVLHKAADLAAARARLDRLAGRCHSLEAGVALARNGLVLWSTVDRSVLTMRAFSPAERDAVLAAEGEDVLGSVGAYRLEGPSVRLFSAVQGDYFSILGLPLLPLLAALRQYAPETLDLTP